MRIRYDRISICIIAVAAVALMVVQFLDPFMWFDETGQFFMGLGLNHYSDPFSVRGTLHDVIVNNSIYNLDPGGFSVLTFFWTYISTSVYFLRVLPLLFFIASAYFLYKILTLVEVQKNYLPVFLGIYVIFGCVFFLVSEFRAYSMEMCGTLATLWLFMKYSEDFTYRRLLILSLVASFFCTSRYSFLMVAFVLAIFVLVVLFRKESFWKFFTKALVFGTPLLATVLLIYLFMTRVQGSGNLVYVGYIGSNISLLWSPLSLLFYLNIVLFAVCWKREKKAPVFLVYALSVSLLFFVLSVCSLFPWDIKRIVSVTLLNVLSLLWYVDHYTKGYAEKKWGIYSMDCLIVLISIFLCYKFTHRKIDDVAREFEALDMSKYESVYIPYTNIPDVRYQYEFGRLRDRVAQDGYPDKFVFEVTPERLLTPADVECDLYFHLDSQFSDGFVLEDNCRYSFRKVAVE